MATKSKTVVERVAFLIGEATGHSRASASLARELEAEGLLAEKRTRFHTVEEAQANGLKSGMLIGGDTFGSEEDI